MMQEILAAREARAAKIKMLTEKYAKTLICFTMNIPDEEKNNKLIDFAFACGCEQIETLLGHMAFTEKCTTAAGPEAYYICELPAESVKRLTRMIEEGNPVGRLYDIDVYTENGEKIASEVLRKCLLCENDAFSCVKAKRHSVKEVRAEADRLLKEFAADRLAKIAERALIEEVNLTPKPGLVDKSNSGAHPDMNVLLFEKSADALLPYFRKAALLGMERENCMVQLQEAGKEAEKIMFEATAGVNTHKGAIFLFGLFLASLGSALTQDAEIFSNAVSLALDYAPASEPTHGEEVRKTFPKCGPLYEAKEGFPNVISAYNVLCESESLYRTLLWLIASVPDSNLLYRGGQEGLQFAQDAAKKYLHDDENALRGDLILLDQQFCEKNLSPGGSADLLSLALFLKYTENIWLDED